MKKLNNKGVTLVELIVSFAIVGVAIIYFFQTLYTVKVIYSDARKETQKFVDKDYALRILDAYLDNHDKELTSFCTNYGVECNDVNKYNTTEDGVYEFKITMKSGETVSFFKHFES